MFSGGSEHSVDDKGRIVIPVRFREELDKDFVITKGMGKCLFVMTKKKWNEQFEQVFANNSMMEAPTNLLLRFFFAEAAIDTNIDGQGRVALPATLREYAGIKPENPVMVVGVLNRIEIWSKDRWLANNETITEELLVAAANQLGVGKDTVKASV